MDKGGRQVATALSEWRVVGQLDVAPRPGSQQRTYLLHIPNWVLGWHFTLAALHASQALVMRGARGAEAAWARDPIVSMPRP